MKCVILENDKVRIINYHKDQDIEEILTENYDYKLGEIQYQCYQDNMQIEVN